MFAEVSLIKDGLYQYKNISVENRDIWENIVEIYGNENGLEYVKSLVSDMNKLIE